MNRRVQILIQLKVTLLLIGVLIISYIRYLQPEVSIIGSFQGADEFSEASKKCVSFFKRYVKTTKLDVKKLWEYKKKKFHFGRTILFIQNDTFQNKKYIKEFCSNLKKLKEVSFSRIIPVIQDFNTTYINELILVFNEYSNAVIVSSLEAKIVFKAKGINIPIIVIDDLKNSNILYQYSSKNPFIYTVFATGKEPDALIDIISIFKDAFLLDNSVFLRINVERGYVDHLDPVYEFIKNKNIRNVLVTEAALSKSVFYNLIKNTNCLIFFAHDQNDQYCFDYIFEDFIKVVYKDNPSIDLIFQNTLIVSKENLNKFFKNSFLLKNRHIDRKCLQNKKLEKNFQDIDKTLLLNLRS